MMPLEGQQARLLTDTSAEALRLISEAKEISFKIALKNAGSGTFDPTADEIADFVQAAKAIIENNMLSLSTNAGIEDVYKRQAPRPPRAECARLAEGWPRRTGVQPLLIYYFLHSPVPSACAFSFPASVHST